jgi:protocatechuate 3,4-dioxygenase beta subunit
VAPPSTCSQGSGEIGDRVWKDSNGNGLQDPGEGGLPNVPVTISGDVTPLTVFTDADGFYRFTDLCAGTYMIEVETPTDLVPTLANVGSDPTIDSEQSPATVVLPDDLTIDLTIDFGFSGTACIGDTIWIDENCNGLQDDPVGPPLDGIRIVLRDGRGVDVSTSTSAGLYVFTGLCAGTYTVTVDESTLPPGLMPTQCNVGSDPTIDSECSPATVTLTSNGEKNQTVDFGYCVMEPSPGSIGDFVWHDENGNGLQDLPEEEGIPGVRVELKDRALNVLASTETDENGNYRFDGLPPDDYVVELITPPCFVPSPCDIGPDDTIDNDCSPEFVTLAPGERNLTVDFGFIGVGTGLIGDFVWNDLDCNGLQDLGEGGIELAKVTLFDEWGAEVGVFWTGPDGRYAFESLCAGIYTVHVDVSAAGAGFVPSPCNVGGDDTIDSECSPAQLTLPFDDTVDRTIDFGYCVPEPLAGCSHGFWKNHLEEWTAPYSPSTPFDEVFEDAFPGRTLLEVLKQGGGGLNALGREAVAALLNAASPGVSYPLPDSEVIERFNAVYPGSKQEYNQLKDELEADNNLGCPLP